MAVLARRMGMRWKDFCPSDGIMRAEGHSHVITSTVIRGLGLVLQYNYTGRDAELSRPSKWRPSALAGTVYKEREEIYIPTAAADRLGAGIVRGHFRLDILDYAIGNQLEVITALSSLGLGITSAEALKLRLKEDLTFTCPVGDIVALTTSMICQAGSPLVQVPAPSDNMDGITTNSKGRIAFEAALYKHVKDRDGPTAPVDAYDNVKFFDGFYGTRHCFGWFLAFVPA